MSAVQNAPAPVSVLQQIHPDLLRLAQIVSLAARVEPQLVRLARLALLPWAEAGLEADLWFSSLVQARSTLALVLQPELLPDLRRGLANDQELLRRAWSAVLTQIHPAHREGATPPLILLEEELVYRGLLENDPAAAPRIAELLKQAMKTMKDDKERGPALARWALHTYPHLPVQVQQAHDAPNFQALAAYVAGRLGSAILQGADSAGASQITISTTDPVDIWVRLLETGLELSRAQSDGGNPIPTQRFDTIWVEISWGEGPTAQAQTVVVPPSGSVQVTASPDVFRVRTVAGDVYTLRALGSPVTRAPPAMVHALLIGIDGYPSHFPALQGCVNDVAAIAGVLSDPAGIGLPPEQVRMVPLVAPATSLPPSLNQAAPATRANLLAALQELGGPEVRAGDRIFVYFAGYGTQVTQGGNAQDALVTSDGQLIYATELGELLVAIAARTDDVTVILDCGFSDGAREAPIADDRRRSRSLARAIALNLPSPTSPSMGSGRILQGAITGRVILLAAQPHEPAYEIMADGTPNGVLTAALTSILAAVDPAQRPTLRWVDIVPDLLNRVVTLVPTQRPLLAGYQERHVFGGPWTRRDPGFVVRRNADGSFQIAAGSLMGVTEGAIIAVYGPNPAVFPPLGSQDDLAVRVGELQVITAARATAVAEPISSGSPLVLPAGARGRMAQPGASERLRVHVNPPDPALAEMLERSPALHVTSAQSEAEVTVQGSSEQGWTISNEIEPVVAQVSPDQRSVLPTALEAYALYNTVLRLASVSNDPVLAGALNVTLLDANDSKALDRIDAGSPQTTQVQSPPLSEAPRNERGMYRLSPSFAFCLHVSNMSANVLFFTVLNCTSGGRVEYLGDGTVVPGGSVLMWANNRTRQPFVASLAQGRNRQIDRVVVVATTDQAIDLRFLAVERRVQEVIDEVSGTRGIVAQVEVPQAGVRTAGLWTAVTVPWLIEEAKAVEKFRLDVATAQNAVLDEPFDLAVALVRPNAPPLVIEDLPVVRSTESSAYRPSTDKVIHYRIVVTGANCDVAPPFYTILMRPSEDSKPRYFQITLHNAEKSTLVVNAYQGDDVLAAQARVEIEVHAPVRTEPSVSPEKQPQQHDGPVQDIVLSPAEVKQFKEALLSAFQRTELEQVVLYSLEVQLDQIVALNTYDKEVTDLVIWTNENNKVAALLKEARNENESNANLRDFDAYLQAKQSGSGGADEAIDPFDSLKPDLLNELLKLPVTETAQDRTSLLDGIPGAGTLNREAGNRRLDLNLIVTQLAQRSRLANGELPLVKFIDNALRYAAGYEGEAELRAIQQSLEALSTPKSPTEEEIRLDVATTQNAVLDEPFDLAVALVRPGAPPLSLGDLPTASTAEGTANRPGTEQAIRYRIEVTGANCDVTPPSFTILQRRDEDSEPRYFQITPHKAGKCTLVVNAYQENEVLAAQTRVEIEVQAPVRSEPNVPLEEHLPKHDEPAVDVVLSPSEIRQFREALRSAFTRSGLEQIVFFGLEVRLDQIVSPSNYDKEIADLVMWVNDNNKVSALLQEARRVNFSNAKLNEFDAYLKAKQAGSGGTGASVVSAEPFAALKPDLLNELLTLAVTETFNGRTSLLDGIPGADRLNRSAVSRRVDLDMIVTQLAQHSRLVNGQVPLVKFIDNALPYAVDYEGEAKLQAIQQSLEALSKPVSPSEETTRPDTATSQGAVQPGAPPREFIEIQRHLVNTLLKIPAMADSNSRTKLLDGLPDPKLVRNYNNARLDLNSLIGGLQKMGRLTKQGGTRPVIVLVDNALLYVSEGSELADELYAIKQDLEAFYGGEVQPAPPSVPAEILEALILGPQRDTQLSSAFLDKAQLAARSVARLAVARIINGVPDGSAVYGTSWIIAPGIIITTHNVINARSPGENDAESADLKAQTADVVARFDYKVEAGGAAYLECRGGMLLAQSKELDYAIVELNEADKIADRAPLRVVPEQPMLVRGSRMNILQYPQGGPLRIAIRNNFFVGPGRAPALLWYQTDTQPGASGSPVCNDNWEVVALHHASTRVDPMQVPQEVMDGQPAQVKILNEGIKIRDILDSLPADVKQRIEAAQAG